MFIGGKLEKNWAPEAGFSGNQTKLKWNLGQVGTTKFDSLKDEKILFLGNELAFWSYLAQVPLKFCLGTEQPAPV